MAGIVEIDPQLSIPGMEALDDVNPD